MPWARAGWSSKAAIRFFETNAVLSEHKTHAYAEADAEAEELQSWLAQEERTDKMTVREREAS
jgi:hypothetical protein